MLFFKYLIPFLSFINAQTFPSNYRLSSLGSIQGAIRTICANFDSSWCLIPTQSGRLYQVRNNVISLLHTFSVSSFGERGLLGVDFHPNFQSNNRVYFYYTKTNGINSVWYYTYTGSGFSNGKEILTVDGEAGPQNHNAGDIRFLNGCLLVSVGEQATASYSQSLSTMRGKLLRITDEGLACPGNPFISRTDNGRFIYAYGLRNGFSFDINNNRILLNDVGGNNFEEINDIVSGGNYGWPNSEGYTSNSAYVSPLHAYNHSQGCAVAGAAFINSNEFLFGDYCRNTIRKLTISSRSVSTFASGLAGNIVGIGNDNIGNIYFNTYTNLYKLSIVSPTTSSIIPSTTTTSSVRPSTTSSSSVRPSTTTTTSSSISLTTSTSSVRPPTTSSSSISSTTSTPASNCVISNNFKCDANIKCPEGFCCSQYGWCGTTADYCSGSNCKFQCDKKVNCSNPSSTTLSVNPSTTATTTSSVRPTTTASSSVRPPTTTSSSVRPPTTTTSSSVLPTNTSGSCSNIKTYSNTRMLEICPTNFPLRDMLYLNKQNENIDLQNSLANYMFDHCGSWCVYSFSDLNKAWSWTPSQNKYVLLSGTELLSKCPVSEKVVISNRRNILCSTPTSTPTSTPISTPTPTSTSTAACGSVKTYSNTRMVEICPTNFSQRDMLYLNKQNEDVDLQNSLANFLFDHCGSWCVYSFNDLNKAWSWTPSQNKYVLLTGTELVSRCPPSEKVVVEKRKASLCNSSFSISSLTYTALQNITFTNNEKANWVINLHHKDHTHPFLTIDDVASGTFTIPDKGEMSTEVFYRINKGNEFKDTKPLLINLTFKTNCSSLNLLLDDGTQFNITPTTNKVIPSVQNFFRDFEVLTPPNTFKTIQFYNKSYSLTKIAQNFNSTTDIIFSC